MTFEVSADRFAYCGRQGRIVDSGAIELMFGHSSSDIAHRALLEVTGTTRKVGSDRTLTTPVTVERSGVQAVRRRTRARDKGHRHL